MRSGALGVAMLFTVAGAAEAREPLAVEMQSYFDAEKAEGYAWMGFGSASLTSGGALVEHGGSLARGLAVPLLVFGAVEMISGLWLLGISDSRLAGLERELVATPEALRSRELHRITTMNRIFVLLRGGEIALAAGGAASAIAGAVTREDFFVGLGVTLVIECGVLLLLDAFAARRALRYTAALDAVHF